MRKKGLALPGGWEKDSQEGETPALFLELQENVSAEREAKATCMDMEGNYTTHQK